MRWLDDLGPEFGLYIHWPYCSAKCPYCDFNSHVATRIDHAAWAEAYQREIERIAGLIGTRVLSTIYFGGGTPSLMEAGTVEAVIRQATAVWAPANDLEVTLEANPTSVEAGRFRAFRDAGVNRVSLGVQALNDLDLRRLGRMHTADEALAALEIARETFDRVSFDLIYARQDQTLEAWEAELEAALRLMPDHLSMYQLTIEPGTVFGRRAEAGRLPGLPDEGLEADMYAVTQERTDAAGLPAYEVSNHAAVGQEARHNLIYWTGREFAGIGPGAHGRIEVNGHRMATAAVLSPDEWLAGDGAVYSDWSVVPRDEQLTELLLMGLRLRDGVRLDRLAALGFDLRAANDLRDEGWLEVDGPRLRLTEAGRPLLNAVLERLV
ncbi:MAG: radical SAM family heme chaperone HemW [Pseudomonadota bacterium]